MPRRLKMRNADPSPRRVENPVRIRRYEAKKAMVRIENFDRPERFFVRRIQVDPPRGQVAFFIEKNLLRLIFRDKASVNFLRRIDVRVERVVPRDQECAFFLIFRRLLIDEGADERESVLMKCYKI